MKQRPCAIANCSALAIQASSYCAVHDAMTAYELSQERRDAEHQRPKLIPLQRVAERIERK